MINDSKLIYIMYYIDAITIDQLYGRQLQHTINTRSYFP